MQSSTPSDLERSVPESQRHSTASGAEMLAQHIDPAVPSATKARLHLPYLDGIRALMALYVVHNHLISAVRIPHTPFGWRPAELLQMFYQGHYSVAVFIVLSGYCLMLPVLRDNGTLRGGIATFFKRRARRILPPYYASLLGAAIIFAVASRVVHHPVPELTSWKRWALHLFLVHNFSWEHIYDYNGALWSIATEWQIYFLFPFLFLPIWKRFGEGALVAVATALAAVLVLAFPSIAKGCPWFVILFAFGMIAARWSLQPAAWMKRIPWVWIGIVLVIGMYFVIRMFKLPDGKGGYYLPFEWFRIFAVKGQIGWYQLTDIIFGFATFCFLLHGTWATLEGRASKFLAVLTWRPLVFVGAFSYSLYLIHMPVQNVVLKLVSHLGLSRPVLYGGMVVLYIPFAVLLAYGFYQLFEKPFLGAPKPKNPAVKPSSA
ncbi:hypothetical protein IAD21_03639 [Abditibacteriota bacterium]|nr:hypothetical protein IAD21_03639 [Abditibacteriota bacterium]